MESTTSFDLTRQIQHWRDNLAASPAFRGENLDELESHLRDSITTLQSHGLHPDEAFIIAGRRIGKGSSLETEFAKVNRRALMLDRALWMLVGIQLWPMANSVFWATAANAIRWGWWSWDSMHHRVFRGNMDRLNLLPQVLALAPAILVCWWLVTRNGEKLARWLAPLLNRGWTQTAACVWLCLAWMGVYTLCLLLHGPYVSAVKNVGFLAKNVHFFIGPAIQAVVLMILTLALARKRLRLT
jgi:hypothetical protein